MPHPTKWSIQPCSTDENQRSSNVNNSKEWRVAVWSSSGGRQRSERRGYKVRAGAKPHSQHLDRMASCHHRYSVDPPVKSITSKPSSSHWKHVRHGNVIFIFHEWRKVYRFLIGLSSWFSLFPQRWTMRHATHFSILPLLRLQITSIQNRCARNWLYPATWVGTTSAVPSISRELCVRLSRNIFFIFLESSTTVLNRCPAGVTDSPCPRYQGDSNLIKNSVYRRRWSKNRSQFAVTSEKVHSIRRPTFSSCHSSASRTQPCAFQPGNARREVPFHFLPARAHHLFSRFYEEHLDNRF
jgi:hypothetical protein